MGMPKQVPVKWGPALLRARALWLSPYPTDMIAATRESGLACNAWAKRVVAIQCLDVPTPEPPLWPLVRRLLPCATARHSLASKIAGF
jgi:hypothetical protein